MVQPGSTVCHKLSKSDCVCRHVVDDLLTDTLACHRSGIDIGAAKTEYTEECYHTKEDIVIGIRFRCHCLSFLLKFEGLKFKRTLHFSLSATELCSLLYIGVHVRSLCRPGA